MRRLFARDRDRPSIEGYHDLQLIGSGGFSRVYRAIQPAFDRPVAIKVITVSVGAGDVARFADELRITGRLEGHPNVIRVYDSGRTSGGRPFLSMELFEKGSYSTWLRKHGPLRVPDVVSAGVKLAGALQAAHDRSVIHRDIKPQNILRSPFVGPVLADFGIAGLLERRGAVRAGSDSEAFSVLHAAPEVLAGERATASSDLYSLASSLYELLTGRPPFHDPSAPGVLDVLARVDAGDVMPISRPDLPGTTGEVIVGMLARNRADRPASGIEFASRLQALEADLGLPPTEVPGYEGAGAGRFRKRPEDTPATGGGPLPQPPRPESTGPEHDPSTNTLLPEAPAPPLTDTVRRRPPEPSPRPAGEEPPGPRRWPRRVALAAGGLAVLAAGLLAVRSFSGDGDAVPTTTTLARAPSSTTATAPTTPACPDLRASALPEPEDAQPPPAEVTVDTVDGGLEVTWRDRTGGAAGHVVFLRCVRDGGTVTAPVASAAPGTSGAILPVALTEGTRWCAAVGSVQPGQGTRLPDDGEQFVCHDL